MRILLLADDCHPTLPSLPVVGYKTARALADKADVVLVTHIRNEAAISAAGGCGRARMVYVDNDYVRQPVWRISRFLRGGQALGWTTMIALSYLSYLAFEWEVWKRFRDDLRAGRFDVVHRLTPMSPVIPSPMARWSPVPFVIGPLNGGLPWPPGFRGAAWREREWLTPFRKLHRLLPYYRSTFRRSAVILAGFPHTVLGLPRTAADRIIDFPEVGIDPAMFVRPSDRSAAGPIRFVFVGRLVPCKCAEVAILAFANSPILRGHHLTLVGDGVLRPALEQLIATHGLEACVEITGWKPQEEVPRYLHAADVFVFPSVRELGAGVVVEAMASGLAPVVVDYGAPGHLASEYGFCIPLASTAAMARDFGAALEWLATHPARCRAMGRAACEWARALFTWEGKATSTLMAYRWATGELTKKPSFYPEGYDRVTQPRHGRHSPSLPQGQLQRPARHGLVYRLWLRVSPGPGVHSRPPGASLFPHHPRRRENRYQRSVRRGHFSGRHAPQSRQLR